MMCESEKILKIIKDPKNIIIHNNRCWIKISPKRLKKFCGKVDREIQIGGIRIFDRD